MLIVEPSESVGELITRNLEREFGAEVLQFRSAKDALEVIKSGQHFDLFVVRNHAAETNDAAIEPIAAQMLNYIYDKQIQIPLIVIGEFEHTFKKYAMISERLRIEELNRLILKALKLKREDFSHLKLPDYVPFPIKYFNLMTLSPCDVYIKLSKKTGDEFVKRLNYGEKFTKEDLQKYSELGLTEFYILKEERELYLNGLITQSLNSLKHTNSIDEAVEKAGESFVISADLIKTLNISSTTVTMVDETITVMREQLTKSPKLGPLLKKILDDTLSYSYRRSYLINLLAYTLMPRMEWGSGDKQEILLEKITYVSFFHDIYLEEERLLKIMDNDQLKKAQLSIQDKELVVHHANKAALLVQSFPRLPQGVDLIIKQHHGLSNGVGFPEALSAGISPMAIFFVVVEDFATQILESGDLAKINEAVLFLKAKYQLPSYRKIVAEIEIMMLKK